MKIQNPNFSTAKYDHTTSMKEFQLSTLDLQEHSGQYDELLLEEVQDMNPCMLDISLEQIVPKIVVGDNFQQTYSGGCQHSRNHQETSKYQHERNL